MNSEEISTRRHNMDGCPPTSSHQLSVDVTGSQYPAPEGGYGIRAVHEGISRFSGLK